MKYVFAISLFLFGLLFSFGAVHAQQQTTCEFGEGTWTDNVSLEPRGEQGTFNPDNPFTAVLEAFLAGACEGYTFEYQIQENGDTVFSESLTIPEDNVVAEVTLRTGTTDCEQKTTDDDCDMGTFARIIDDNGNTLDSYTTTIFAKLEYEVEPGDEDDYPWARLGLNWTRNQNTASCLAVPVSMEQVNTDGSRTPLVPGNQPGNFFSDDDPPRVSVTLRVKDCGRVSGQVVGPVNNKANLNVTRSLSYILTGNEVRTPHDDVLLDLVYTLGEEDCGGPNITQERCSLLFFTSAQLLFMKSGRARGSMNQNNIPGLSNDFFQAMQNTGGYLTYDCDDECDTEWGRKTVTNPRRCLDDDCTETQPIDIAENPFLAGYLNSIQNSPCYIPPDANDPQDVGSIKPDCYDLLAPLPGLVALGVPDNTTTQDGIQEGTFTTQFSLGQWVNRILMFLIGLTGLLAVVMIVIAGAQYMTSEAIGKKTDAKDRIVQSLIGLVLSLGIFVLLNTINPTLLDIDPEIEEVTFEFDVPETGIPISGVNVNDIPGDPVSGTDPVFAAWARDNIPPKTLTDANTGQTITVRACDDNNLVTRSVLGGGQTRIHRSLVASLNRVNSAYQVAINQGSSYPIVSVGGYSCRLTKDSNGNPQINSNGEPSISNHAYGLAIDINSANNGIIESVPPNRSDYTDMPQWFVDIWKNEGWGWGGDWTSKKDAMHFSKAPGGELGDGLGEL